MNHVMLELACAVADTNPKGSRKPSHAGLLPIGTKVVSKDMEGRATGKIVGYNDNTRNAFYSSADYPYVIKWCDGYRDYYGIDGKFIAVA